MKRLNAKSLLERQLKKEGLSEDVLPKDLTEWKSILARVTKTYQEYDEARMSSENVLEVTLREIDKRSIEFERVTQAKLNLAVERQAEAEIYARYILESIQQGVWGLNLAGEVTFINGAAIRILGYSTAREVLGQPIHKLVQHTQVDGSPYPRERSPIYDSFINKKIHHVEGEVFWRKNGTSFPVNYFSAPIFVSGQCVGSVVSFEDLTEYVAMQADIENKRRQAIQNSKLTALGELAAGIAHEINNPLTIISSVAGLLPKCLNDPEKLKSRAESIEKSCTRIAKIVSGLKKFSRSGDSLEMKPHKFADIGKEVLVLSELKTKRENTAITFSCNTEAEIFCNDVEIEQVLINLINNAVDAIRDKAERWIKIAAREENGSVVVSVTDSGNGIPEKVQKRLFEPFFTTKEVGKGTGLGLSISRGILEDHKATIQILNDSPHTCFEIRFPKHQASERAA